jgi:photosystem I P700 chlorophyll a apoprotein A2
LFYVACQGNFEALDVHDPLHGRPISHAILDPQFGKPTIESFTRGGFSPGLENIGYHSVYQ